MIRTIEPEPKVVLMNSCMLFSMKQEDCESEIIGVFNNRQELYTYLELHNYTEEQFDNELWYGEEAEGTEYAWFSVQEVEPVNNRGQEDER